MTLLYLFWEPTNAADFQEFRHHREEISGFRESVSDSTVRFTAMSYPELWADWKTLGEPAWLGAHVTQLQARYLLAI